MTHRSVHWFRWQRCAVLCSAVFVLLVVGFGRGTANAVQTEPLHASIDSACQEFMETYHVPGLSVAISNSGDEIYTQGFGFADLENSVAATATSVYRTASIAKPMTATAVLQLVGRGKINLDDPIQKYCPEFPEKEWPISVRQLLCHQSGVRHYKTDAESEGKEFFPTIQSSIRIFADDPLRHQPGTRYTYTTFGYSLLGRAVEEASGLSFGDYLQQNIFQPAGMTQSTIDWSRVIIPQRARGYVFVTQEDFDQLPAELQAVAAPNRHFNAALHDTSMKIPGGGLVSTAPDLVRFAQGWLDHSLVDGPTVKSAWTAQETLDGTPTRYGLGWGVREDSADQTIVSHSGGQAGVSTMLWIVPERNVIVAVMCNLEGAPCGRLAEQLAAMVLTAKSN